MIRATNLEEDEVGESCKSCERGCKIVGWWYFGGDTVRCLRDVFGVGCGMSAICLRENNNKTFYMLVSRLFPRFWW